MLTKADYFAHGLLIGALIGSLTMVLIYGVLAS